LDRHGHIACLLGLVDAGRSFHAVAAQALDCDLLRHPFFSEGLAGRPGAIIADGFSGCGPPAGSSPPHLVVDANGGGRWWHRLIELILVVDCLAIMSSQVECIVARLPQTPLVYLPAAALAAAHLLLDPVRDRFNSWWSNSQERRSGE
jgi:hypothetical protein